MSAPPTVPNSSSSASSKPPKKRGRLSNFWFRVSEGRAIDDLWGQFVADARASYGFYGKDVDWEEVESYSHWRRPFHIARQFFWALMLKLSPARRVLLVIALVLLVLSGFGLRLSDQVVMDTKTESIAALLLLLLLSLELADKVIMKRDLEIAREIQNWLVPSQPPDVPGAEIAFATRPQNSVAGDYYDAFYPTVSAAEGGKLLLVVADVAGKSVPAALLMATMQASLRTIAGDNAPLDALVARLNRYASAYSLGGRRFTTAILGSYDPASGELIYVNAGHNAPVVRRSNQSMEFLDKGGLPLGIEPSAAYETGTVSLHAGDTLVMFTDGVVEAFNKSGDEFGNGRWLDAIRTLPPGTATQALQYLMRQVDRFVGATRQSDDITCLIFQCK
ncbi:MAG TPA: PP2C family protein-serine/threonine phosphatase [Candidatus Eremiobacteraceae bacterium]|nr:PP2C family protein-serine/threonine phosphatase [Candidatus Eremiobacteraceae bacterium]